MDKQIRLTINDKPVSVREGSTILEAAKDNGFDIPTLCYVSDCPPVGACRVCVVEVEGSRTLVGACHTPVTEGIIVRTHSAKVLQARRVMVELMLASHPDSCLICDKANICELRKLSTDLDIGLPRFRARKHYYPVEVDNPNIIRDMSKCVLCRRCVSVCRSIRGTRLFSVAYRGFDSKVVHGLDEPLQKDACGDCHACVTSCPTGALSNPSRVDDAKAGTVLYISSQG